MCRSDWKRNVHVRKVQRNYLQKNCSTLDWYKCLSNRTMILNSLEICMHTAEKKKEIVKKMLAKKLCTMHCINSISAIISFDY